MGYGADEIYTRWSLRALPVWRELLAEAGEPHLFQRTGVLWMAYEAEPYSFASIVALQRAGVEFERLSSTELRHRYPQIFFEENAWGLLSRIVASY